MDGKFIWAIKWGVKMKKFKNALIVLLISFTMSFSVWPSIGYAQFFQQDNSLNENQTEDNLDNKEVESQVSDEEQYIEENSQDETESPSVEEPEEQEPQEPQQPEESEPEEPQEPEEQEPEE